MLLFAYTEDILFLGERVVGTAALCRRKLHLVSRQPWEVRRAYASIFSMRTAIEREDELVDAMFNCG
jgi:hypothetical protein